MATSHANHLINNIPYTHMFQHLGNCQRVLSCSAALMLASVYGQGLVHLAMS
jgi:hypothetical protein